MKLGIKGFLVIFTIYFGLGVMFSSAIGDEKKEEKVELECSAFINEKICNMTDEERELHFLEFLKELLQQTIDEKKKGLEV